MEIKDGKYKIKYFQARLNNMVIIGRYYYFVINPKALEKIQAQLEIGNLLEKASNLQYQEAAYNMPLEKAALDGILRKSIKMYKDEDSTRRSFTKYHIK